MPEQTHSRDAHIPFLVVTRAKGVIKHEPHQANTCNHMQAMESCEQIEGPPEHTTSEPELKTRPFHILPINEVSAHQHGDEPDDAKAPEVALMQIALGKVDHKAGAHQHDGIDQRHPDLEALDAWRQPLR